MKTGPKRRPPIVQLPAKRSSSTAFMVLPVSGCDVDEQVAERGCRRR